MHFNQSKHIYIALYVVNESEAHLAWAFTEVYFCRYNLEEYYQDSRAVPVELFIFATLC